MQVTGDSTDVTTYFVLRLAADGTEATGLTITNFDLQYVRSGAAPAAKVDATALAATDSAHADNKAIEIDATDQPGLYRVDWPDAAFAAGVKEVILSVKCATAFTEHLRVQIDPPVNLTKWLGTAAATPTVAGVPEIDVTHWNGTAIPAVHTAGYPIVTIKDGTGTGEINTNGGKVVGVELVDVLTTYTGNTVQTGDAYAIVNSGTHGNAALKTLIDAVDNFVDTEVADIQARLPAALVGGRMDANVGAISSDATAADNLEAAYDGNGYAHTGNTYPWTAAWDAEVQSEVQDAIEANHLDHLIAVADPGGVVANSSFLAKLVSKSATPAFSSYDNTTDSHEALRDRGDAAWITATGFSTLDAAGVRSAVGLASANLDTQLSDIDNFLDTEVAAILAAVDTEIATIVTAVGTTIPATLAGLMTTAMTESYRTDGSTGSVAQILYELLAHHNEVSISSTTKTTKKIDGSTTAATYTLNSATTPTAVTRAS